jgi:hypothetical protein
MNHDFRTGPAFKTSFPRTQTRDGPSVTSRRPLTHSSLAEAFRFRHYDALTIDHSLEKFGYRRASAVTIGK